MISGFIMQLESSLLLIGGFLPFLWTLSRELVLFVGLHDNDVSERADGMTSTLFVSRRSEMGFDKSGRVVLPDGCVVR